MRENEKQSILFIILVYLFSWILWIPLINLNSFFISKNTLILAGVYMPSIMGILITKVYSKKSSVIYIMKSLLKFKIQFKEYLIILSYFPIMIGSFFGLIYIIEYQLIELSYPIKVFPLVFFYILVLQGPLGEEFGWRGFLLNRLMTSYSAMISSIIVGIVWTFWHIPLFFIDNTIQWQMLQKFSLIKTLSGYLLYTVLVSILIAIVFTRTNRSVWAAILFHTIANTTLGYAPIMLTAKGSFVLLSILFLVTILSIKFYLKDLIENNIKFTI